jgi:hypothetical protein
MDLAAFWNNTTDGMYLLCARRDKDDSKRRPSAYAFSRRIEQGQTLSIGAKCQHSSLSQKRVLAELREAELVLKQRGQAFLQATAQLRKVTKLHRLAVGKRGAV